MAKINGLRYESVVFWDWDELQHCVEKEVCGNHNYIKLNEIERVEEDIYVTFTFDVKDRKRAITNLKKFCKSETEYEDFLDYLYETSDEVEGEIRKGMILNILTKILKERDSRIEVLGLEASYYGVSIRFDFKRPLVKTAVSVVRRYSIFEDLDELLNRVSGCTYDEHLKRVINDISSDEQQLDFIVEDVLREYMDVNFSNYSIDVLDGDNFDETIVSIAIGC